MPHTHTHTHTHQNTQLHQKFDGRNFTDPKGYVSRVTVEYAPNQAAPGPVQAADHLAGTIADNADYLSFVESLKAGTVPKGLSLTDPSARAADKDGATLDDWLAREKEGKGKVCCNGPTITTTRQTHTHTRHQHRRSPRRPRSQTKSAPISGAKAERSARGTNGGEKRYTVAKEPTKNINYFLFVRPPNFLPPHPPRIQPSHNRAAAPR